MDSVDSPQDPLLELARQLLPLGTWREVARDGLLCIAGIQGMAAGAVLWRADEGPLHLLSHFGLGAGRLRGRFRLPAEAQGFLLETGPLTLEAARRRPAGRGLLRALQPLDAQLGEAWLFPLHAEGKLRGLLCVGPSLVTQELVAPDAIGGCNDMAELLRLRLLGCASDSGVPLAEERPAPADSRPLASSGRGVASRLRHLRSRYPDAASMVGESAAMLAHLEEIVSLADTDYTVLVEGETGTGKELAAHLLHRSSRRAQGPFEAVDCSAIPQELIESELFGHVKGAFTGASRDFRGAFERADGGTLLLDEIGDMDLRSQTRLLRVLQEGQVRRLGGDRPVPVDVRVVAATNQELAALVRQSRFREDLYYRIHVCPVRVPSLRERGDDRQVLFEHFMAQHAAELQRPARRLTPAGRRRLRSELFPGNVRQLQNVVRQLLVPKAARGPVDADELERVLRRASSQGLQPRRARPAHEAAEERAEMPPPTAEVTRLVESGRKVRDAPPTLPSPPTLASPNGVEDVGNWVLERLREHRFNLSSAARSLQEQRRQGASREAVPVFDRGALDYYLCGEFFRALVGHAYAVDAALQHLAPRAPHSPRLRRKVQAFVRPLRSWQRRTGAQARARLHEVYRRVPETYLTEIEQAAAALRRGRWRLP